MSLAESIGFSIMGLDKMGSLSRIQGLVRLLTPSGLFSRIEAESKTWFFKCPCGWEIPVWETGGIRYKASKTRKKSLGKCPECGKMRWFSIYRKT